MVVFSLEPTLDSSVEMKMNSLKIITKEIKQGTKHILGFLKI